MLLANLQPFLAIFCQLHKHLSQNLGADGHFEGLNVSKFQLNQFYDINYKCPWQVCFSILEEKKIKDKCFKNGHFLTICGHFFGNYIDIFHKTEIQMVILRCIVCLNLNWIKSYNIMLVKKIFLCLKMHHFRAILPKWILTTFRKPAVIFSKQLFFQNSMELWWPI